MPISTLPRAIFLFSGNWATFSPHVLVQQSIVTASRPSGPANADFNKLPYLFDRY